MTRPKIIKGDRLTVVWLFLISATILSWAIGHEWVADDSVATAAVIVVAFMKVRLVGLDFMELRSAPKLMRLAFEVWVLATCAALIVLSEI
jgi:hypothetical protein